MNIVDDIPLLEVLGICICLVLSCLFSGTETALTATPHHKIKKFIKEGKDPTRVLTLWITHPNRVLTTILIVNNLVNILAAVLAADITYKIFGRTEVAITTAVMTILILIVGEVLPKTLAKQYAERMSPWVAPLLLLPYWVFYPASWLLVKLLRSFVRLLGGELMRRDPIFTEEDIEDIISLTDEEARITKEKRTLLGRIFEMGKTTVKEIMIARTDMVAVKASASFDEILKTAISSGHSRIPVYKENLDNIIGFIYVKGLLNYVASGQKDFKIENFLRPTYHIPETKPISELLREFQKMRRHISIVVDEYGGTAGIITLEDILEEIVGEIEDEHEEGKEKDLYAVAPDTYLAHGRVPLARIEDELGISFPQDEEYDSVGGFISAQLGHVPKKGEHILFNDTRLTVEEATPKRILRVKIQKTPPVVPAK